MSEKDTAKEISRREFMRDAAAAGGGLAGLSLFSGAAKAQAEAQPPAPAQGGAKVLRVGMLSSWHVHALGYADQLRQMPNVKITAVYDETAGRAASLTATLMGGQVWAARLGVPLETNLDAFLKREDVDAVVVCAPTNKHADVMVAAANAGKHIFTEKVMALTVKDCDRISEAVKKAGVKFCISFPARCSSQHLYAKKVVEERLIGKTTLMRVRVAHNGASAGWLPGHFYDPVACGGGAMMDLGAHPMYLARWIMGKPARITSMFNYVTGHKVEDNAICAIEFASKATAVVETSFVSTNSPDIMELHGTEGALFIGGPEGKVLIRSAKAGGKGDKWVTPPELPPGLPSPIRQWVSGITEGGAIHFGLEEGRQLTELMENAYIAHRTGKVVEFA
ncbi:MAG TPA: Gfo/Idh/MocA family oxidoreductase [Candidatus Brocadiia bacterium]|nr:Gfo/Idh/MocA family oxidoreductase [Candidatus Brocadiia bacterium]